MALGGMADAVDALATVLAFGSLPRRRRWGILAVTAGAAVASTRAAAALDARGTGVSRPRPPTGRAIGRPGRGRLSRTRRPSG